MEYEKIKVLLEKYWESSTNPEEEDMLRAYFRQENIPAEWHQYKMLFQYYDQQKALKLRDEFDEKLLYHINNKRNKRGFIKWLRTASYSAAAAIVLLLGVYFYKQQKSIQTTAFQEDTFQDPQRAMAEVQRALLLVSKKMKEGEKLTTQKMQKLNTLNKAIDTDQMAPSDDK